MSNQSLEQRVTDLEQRMDAIVEAVVMLTDALKQYAAGLSTGSQS